LHVRKEPHEKCHKRNDEKKEEAQHEGVSVLALEAFPSLASSGLAFHGDVLHASPLSLASSITSTAWA
jgi:hypothetical protein